MLLSLASGLCEDHLVLICHIKQFDSAIEFCKKKLFNGPHRDQPLAWELRLLIFFVKYFQL